MKSPSDRRYSASHEWFLPQGETITIGITRHAVDELTDVTYVETKPVGTAVEPGAAVGEVESVKTTSEVYSPLGGTIVEVNAAAIADPSLLNSDPFGAGWLVRIRPSDSKALGSLLDAAAYDAALAAG